MVRGLGTRYRSCEGGTGRCHGHPGTSVGAKVRALMGAFSGTNVVSSIIIAPVPRSIGMRDSGATVDRSGVGPAAGIRLMPSPASVRIRNSEKGHVIFSYGNGRCVFGFVLGGSSPSDQ